MNEEMIVKGEERGRSGKEEMRREEYKYPDGI